jgi:hypothetical protein
MTEPSAPSFSESFPSAQRQSSYNLEVPLRAGVAAVQTPTLDWALVHVIHRQKTVVLMFLSYSLLLNSSTLEKDGIVRPIQPI